MNNNDDNLKEENNGKNKVEGKETINFPDGVRVEFEGYYNQNKPYNGKIKKYDKDNNLIMEGGFLCTDEKPTYDKRNYHGEIKEYRNSKILHTGTYEKFGGERTIPIGEHRYYSNGIIKRIETYNQYGKLDGDVKRYDDFGNLKFSGKFNNGVCHGTYYYTDLQNVRHTLYEGDVEFSEGLETYFGPFIATMHDIYPHGNGKVYDGNDCLRYEGRYWNGKRNGLVKEYNMNNGRLKLVGVYEDDIRNGIVREHHNNGQLKRVSEYKDNRLHGRVIEYNDNGKLTLEAKYSNGKPDGMIREYNDNGKLIYEAKYINGNRNGIIRKYHDNGKLKFEGEYSNNMLNGQAKDYNDNGHLIFEGEYINGNRNGIIREYHDNGKLKFEGEYSKDMLNGQAKKYDANGHLIFEGIYKDGKRNGYGKEYDANGNLIFEGEYYDLCRDGHGKEYNANDKVIFEGEYVYDKRDGQGKEYNDDGKVISEGTYIKNRLYDGKRYTYNQEGQLIKTERIENGKVVQQNNNISNENKINLGSQNKNKGLG